VFVVGLHVYAHAGCVGIKEGIMAQVFLKSVKKLSKVNITRALNGTKIVG
jgi:hypothetical protein